MKKSKIFLLALGAIVLVGASVLGTLAYLTSQSTVVNTFTVGNVKINVDEADVNPDGTPIAGASRVTSNEYHLIPGKTYTKDPTMTVVGGSEEAYVRMIVTINCAAEFDAIYAPDKADLTTIFTGYDATEWVYEEVTRDTAANTVTYEFRYKDKVAQSDTDTVLAPLFTALTVPGSFSAEDIDSISDLEISITGHAIQAFGFADEDAAWSAFDAEING